jgi:multicomponent K+:H+ antiporter subunit D
LTIIFGTLGALASPNLRILAGNLVIISVGTLLITFSIGTPEAAAAGFVYLIHSTLVTAALFLIADIISKQRGRAHDYFVVARKMKHQALLGGLFLVVAMAIAGLPPFSGFLGKLIVLQSAMNSAHQIWVWAIILISSLATIIAFSRAGTTLFWRTTRSHDNDSSPISKWYIGGALLLLVSSPLISLFGAHLIEYSHSAAAQLYDIPYLIDAMQLDGGEQ